MGRRISVFIDEDVLELLNEHTQASPLSRSELIGVAVRRFLRDERRRVRIPDLGNDLARLIAAGDLPSRRIDGTGVAARGAPWENGAGAEFGPRIPRIRSPQEHGPERPVPADARSAHDQPEETPRCRPTDI